MLGKPDPPLHRRPGTSHGGVSELSAERSLATDANMTESSSLRLGEDIFDSGFASGLAIQHRTELLVHLINTLLSTVNKPFQLAMERVPGMGFLRSFMTPCL